MTETSLKKKRNDRKEEEKSKRIDFEEKSRREHDLF